MADMRRNDQNGNPKSGLDHMGILDVEIVLLLLVGMIPDKYELVLLLKRFKRDSCISV